MSEPPDITNEPVASEGLALEGLDASGAEQLFPVLYRELHRLAQRQLKSNAPSATLSATTLLHEAFLDLSKRDAKFPSRGQFFSYAARAMRHLIIDYLRERRAVKRGHGFHLTTLDSDIEGAVPAVDGTVQLSDALVELAAVDPPLAELVDLKFFCGFTLAEIAAFRGVTERTVQRDWAKARMLLLDMLQGE
jgi:RNA polymerase sigma factor (TIGR02999 family)